MTRDSGTIRDFWLQLIAFRACLRGKAVCQKRIAKKIQALGRQQNVERGREHERENPLVVSLTSFPERINEVCCTIYSLFEQSCKADHILLWLAEEEFPDRRLPEELAILERCGLEIRWTTNLFSYKKIIPALQIYPEGTIVIVDDDVYYPPDWLQKLYDTYMTDKGHAVSDRIYAHTAHRITLEGTQIASYKDWETLVAPSSSVRNVAVGYGGVLYPPHSLHPDATDSELFMKLCPMGDDIWLWGMSVLNDRKITVIENNVKRFPVTNYLREKGLVDQLRLYTFNREGGNDRQLQALVDHYPELLQKVRQAAKERS